MIAEFITYLQGAGLTPQVRNAFTTDPVENYSDEFPVIMVYPLSAGSEPNAADNFLIQRITHQVVCLLGCSVNDHETLIAELRSSVLGWSPSSEWDVMEHESGNIEGIRGGYLWWRDVYSIWTQLRQT